jgi:hypothetical protein
MAPTALDREILFGNTKMLLAPGIILNPYIPSRLEKHKYPLNPKLIGTHPSKI